MPYPCSHFYVDIKFGNRLYSEEKRRAWPWNFDFFFSIFESPVSGKKNVWFPDRIFKFFRTSGPDVMSGRVLNPWEKMDKHGHRCVFKLLVTKRIDPYRIFLSFRCRLGLCTMVDIIFWKWIMFLIFFLLCFNDYFFKSMDITIKSIKESLTNYLYKRRRGGTPKM